MLGFVCSYMLLVFVNGFSGVRIKSVYKYFYGKIFINYILKEAMKWLGFDFSCILLFGFNSFVIAFNFVFSVEKILLLGY